MRAIIIGAGRGRRLMPLTEDTPKCYAEIAGRRILDHALEGLRAAGLRDVVFVGGFLIERIQADYPELTFRHNREWPNNNILASLFCAEDLMCEGFVCSYADILYRAATVERLLASTADIAIAVDSAWRTRYSARTQHPEDDAEKVLAEGDRVVAVSRTIRPERACGEYIGLAKFSQGGAETLRAEYRRAQASFDGRSFQGAPSLQNAYLIHMFQEMLDHGVRIDKVYIDGGYFEVDTTEDYELARAEWR